MLCCSPVLPPHPTPTELSTIIGSSWDPHLPVLLLHTCPSLANHAGSLKTPHVLATDQQLLSSCSDCSFKTPRLWRCLTWALFLLSELTAMCILVFTMCHPQECTHRKKLISEINPSATNKCHQLSQQSQMCHHREARTPLCVICYAESKCGCPSAGLPETCLNEAGQTKASRKGQAVSPAC